MMQQKQKPDLATLFQPAEKKAEDGHLTVFRFTTEWKVMPGTPDLDIGQGRGQVSELPGYHSLEDALMDFILGSTL